MSILSTPTLQNLIDDTRGLLNSPDPSNSMWKDNEIKAYLDEAIRMYFLECVVANEGYFTTTSNLNITANTETIALPTDCFEIRQVWKKITDGYAILPYRNLVTEGYSTQGGSSSEFYLPYYSFQGQNLVFRPTPNFSETAGIKLEYIQFPDQMIWGGDSLTNQISPVFKQVLVAYAVYKAKFKESLVSGSDLVSLPERHLNRLVESLRATLVRRSKGPTYTQPFNPEV